MLLRVVERLDAIPQGVELVGRELAVDRAPGDGGLGGRLFNDETIDWRTAGAVTGANNQCAGIGKLAFTAVRASLPDHQHSDRCTRRYWLAS
jgi:hypothetical protein